jgi:hypothetical protein
MAEALSPTYEEVVGRVKARSGEGIEGPRPDTPYTEAPLAGLPGDAGHVNPAINPAPIWAPKDRPPPVPVVNDPGLLGAGPSLQDLNNASRVGYGLEEVDQTSGITEESHQAEIKKAATDRLERMKSVQDTEIASASGSNSDKR